MGCITKQFLNKNWILSDHSVPGLCLHMIFAPQSISTPKWVTPKNPKKVRASDGHKRYEVSKFNKGSIFYGFGSWFLDNNKHKTSKFTFSCKNQPIVSENEKWNTSTIFSTHIFAFKVAISFSESLFALKGRNSGPNILGMSWNFGKKIYQVPNVTIQNKITENKENLKTSLPRLTLFCLNFSEHGSFLLFDFWTSTKSSKYISYLHFISFWNLLVH